jgi:hypothetical protein
VNDQAKKVFKYINSIIFIILSSQVIGCDFLYLEEDREILNIGHSVYAGAQSDIHYQRLDVFNNSESFEKFLLTIPSYTGVVPNYNEEQETLVVLTTHAVPCFFAPKVTGVSRENSTGNKSVITVHVRSVSDKNPNGGICDTNGQPVYAIFFVSMAKTDKNISTDIRY